MARRPAKPVKFERNLVFPERNFPLDVLVLDQHPDYPLHVHDFSVISIILRGRGVNVAGGEDFPVKAGDVFVHHGGSPHGYRETENLGLINVLYEPSLLDKVRLDVAGLPGYQSLFVVEPALRRSGRFARHLTLGVDDLGKARQLAETIEKELYGDTPRIRALDYKERHHAESRERHRRAAAVPGHRFMALAQFMSLVVLLARAYEKKPTVASEGVRKIGRVIAHMEEHFAEDLKLPQLARMVGMSDRNFYRCFKEAVGQTPASYLQNLRMAEGARILQTTDRSVTEAAFACGFNDSSYFAREFRRAFGVSPSEFQSGRRSRRKLRP